MNTVAQPAPARNSAPRSFRARYLVVVENAVLSTHDYLLTISGTDLGSYAATVDGQPVSIDEAIRITSLASKLGTFERLDAPTEPEEAPVTIQTAPTPAEAPATGTIGTARAHRLHQLLASEGYRGDHHALATRILKRTVEHLRDLTNDEARRFWTALTRTGIEVAA